MREGEGIFSVILWRLLLFQMVWKVHIVSSFIFLNYTSLNWLGTDKPTGHKLFNNT